ncbi:S-layer homology domain-containing protein [Paenibacillus sp. 1_12]|uniref:S-layer homology domain-containing protein n=1 Tax=Paenibacillus sp. 1_12 TaxID=1566278 RepID=UPI0008F381F4|nr:S-layer homology domain-containing protein [Paenibacillus sp. 1_12]SFL65068.1 S-layer homology domain-containing protein [Paenibacillus sp. 1_12]
MKRYPAKLVSWVMMVCMMIAMMQPLTVPAYAAEATKWVTYKNDDFSNANQVNLFSLNGSTAIVTDNQSRKVLRLTPATGNLFGTAFNKKLIAPGNKYSFSTFFKFNLNSSHESSPADGITFTVQAQSNSAGSVGQGIGYGGITPSFAIKYDTYKNESPVNDPSNNYIGLAVNGNVNNTNANWYTTNLNSVKLADGNDHYTWIDYDGSSNNVKVYISNSLTRPTSPVLDVNGIDLENIFSGKSGVYAGFTAATGGSKEIHDIISWYFVNDLDPIDTLKYTYRQAPTQVTVSATPTGQPGKFNVTTTLLDVDGNPVSDAPVKLSTKPLGNVVDQLGNPLSGLQSDNNGQATAVIDFGGASPAGEAAVTAASIGGAYQSVPILILSTGTTVETASTLTWSSVTGADYYDLYKDGALYKASVTGVTYALTDLTPGIDATFTVKAIKNGVGTLTSNLVAIPSLVALALDSIAYSLPAGSTHQTVVSTVYSDPTRNGDVTNSSNYSSAASGIATVSSSGVVTAVGAGTTVITAVYSGKYVQATVTVPIDAPTGVATSNVTTTEATVSWNAVPIAQSYNIYDNGILIKSGVTDTRYTVTELVPGTVHNFTVSAVSNHIESTQSSGSSVTTSAIRDLKVDPASYTLLTGATHPTKTSAVFMDESVKDVTKQATYISSNPGVASVDANGLITAIAPGTTTITVTYDGKTTTQTIVVQDSVPQFNVTLSASPESVVGDGSSKVTLTARAVSKNGSPVAGVPVTFHFGNNPANDVTAITNEQGIASIEYTTPTLQGTRPVNEVITASAVDPKSGLSTQQSTSIDYLPASVQGIVIDQVTGKPAANSTVKVTADFDGDGIIDFSSTVTTGPDGSYHIGVPRGNFNYTMNIQTSVQIGNQTVTLNRTQTAAVGTLNAVGQKIDSTNKISGQLFIAASSKQTSQPTVGSLFGNGNVSAIIKDMNGNTIISTIALDANGNFELDNVPQGQYKISYQIKAPDGTLLAGPSMTVNVNQNGQLGVAYSLIDPYGIVTDEVTKQIVSGATVNLYWADTDLNKQKGRTPNTLVNLPELQSFAPNQNHNPQITDAAGQYAWMVYPDGDYYIIASKPGYFIYSTLETKPNAPAVNGSDSYIQNGIIHVGQDIVNFNFAMRQIYSNQTSSGSGSGGGSGYVPALPDVLLNLSVDKNLVKEGDTSTITVEYKNQTSAKLESGVISITISEGAELVNADGGTVDGNKISWSISNLAAGEAGSFKVQLKWGLIGAADTQVTIPVQFATNSNGVTTVKADSTIQMKIFSERFGNQKHQRYILGYPDGNFLPDNSLTRAELAAVVARLTENVKVNDALTYTDIREDHWAVNYVKIATKHGYFSGFEDGSFHPEAQVSRGELASVMARFLKLKVSAAGDTYFTDVKDHWAADSIEQLYRSKFLTGYPDGTFKPQDRIHRVEAVTMINRMLYRGPLKGIAPLFPDVVESHWGFGDVQEATSSHESDRNQDGSETWKNKLEDDVK